VGRAAWPSARSTANDEGDLHTRRYELGIEHPSPCRAGVLVLESESTSEPAIDAASLFTSVRDPCVFLGAMGRFVVGGGPNSSSRARGARRFGLPRLWLRPPRRASGNRVRARLWTSALSGMHAPVAAGTAAPTRSPERMGWGGQTHGDIHDLRPPLPIHSPGSSEGTGVHAAPGSSDVIVRSRSRQISRSPGPGRHPSRRW
jgi:hypothetical protein